MGETINFNVIEKYKSDDVKAVPGYVTDIVNSLIVKEFTKAIE